MQFQSGRPFSVFRPEMGLLRLGFQRLDFEFRNFLRGPSQRRIDLGISKTVPFDGRWEIFNLSNTVNLGMPENNFDSVGFGTVTSTVGGPRVSQFGVRLTF